MSQLKPDAMLKGSCHCGTVQLELTASAQKLVNCNCSLCRRLGALWGHVSIETVRITMPAQSTITYIQGSKTLATHSCKTCGCTTHWENLQDDGKHMGVNFRMFEPEVLEQLEVRNFDGADTWQFID